MTMAFETPVRKDKLIESNFLLQNLFKQRSEGTLCDVELHLQDNIVRVHSCVLASQSEYFIDRFEPQNARKTSWDNHWCYRRPLVIDLDSEMRGAEEHCFTCLGKVLDYMYLKELVVIEGHFHHFSEYAKFLKMIELITLCKTYDKNLSVISSSNNEVKSPRACETLKTNLKEHISQGSSLAQDDSYSGVTCEFVCCSEDKEPSTNFSENSRRRSISCAICTFQTVSIKAMIKHVERLNHYGTQCSICKLKIPDEEDLKEHLKDHVGAKPYICHICKKRTRFWNTHKLHLRVHCRNKPLLCGICQTRFKKKKNLVAHMENHAGSSYPCEHCNYFTPDFEIFKTHLKQHSDKQKQDESKESTDTSCNLSQNFNAELYRLNGSKKFICQACGEGFTLKRNLKRHVQLEHFSESQGFKCPMCDYLPKRLDMLKKHMINRHHLKSLEIETILKEAKNREKHKMKESKQSSNILGVLIPVQLVSTSDSSTLNVFAVKTQESGEKSVHNKYKSASVIINNSEELVNSIEISYDNVVQNTITDEFIVSNAPKNLETHVNAPAETFNINELSSEQYLDSSSPKTNNDRVSEMDVVMTEGKHVPCRLPMEAKGAGTTGDEIWLNESTGELLSGSRYMTHLHLLNSECSVRQEFPSLRNLDVSDSFKTRLLNDQAGDISLHDFTEDKDDYFSNPQTPQTNVVDFEDPDNLISWSCLESAFCSTWVLNETTGELNVVSFSVKPFNDSDELKINKKREGLSSTDDDDTALFLNEGTGDLSVIYFNPQNPSNQMKDKLCQEALETMSDHSDDEDINFLNEELLRASTDFMSDDGNERFLNELTGEFDVASFSRFQTDVLDYQTPDNSMYLNEETGEISWNVLDQDANSDIMTTNSDILNLEFDDSMNCEEFDKFPAEAGFTSDFCMETSAPSNWQNMDESCDTLLNECTGELVQKE